MGWKDDGKKKRADGRGEISAFGRTNLRPLPQHLSANLREIAVRTAKGHPTNAAFLFQAGQDSREIKVKKDNRKSFMQVSKYPETLEPDVSKRECRFPVRSMRCPQASPTAPIITSKSCSSFTSSQLHTRRISFRLGIESSSEVRNSASGLYRYWYSVPV